VLAGLFSGACDDERLWGLLVESVEPAPNASRLLVTVLPAGGAAKADPQESLIFLNSARSYLREEVAAAIRWRRVPDLVFQIYVEGIKEQGLP